MDPHIFADPDSESQNLADPTVIGNFMKRLCTFLICNGYSR